MIFSPNDDVHWARISEMGFNNVVPFWMRKVPLTVLLFTRPFYSKRFTRKIFLGTWHY